MDEVFEAGDLVELNSGGPVMVVGEVLHRRRKSDVVGGTKLSCGWFGEGHEFHTGEFPPECVKRRGVGAS